MEKSRVLDARREISAQIPIADGLARGLRAVERFAKHLNTSPDALDYDNVRSFRLHLMEAGGTVASVNQTLTALRFFYRWTLGRADAVWMIPLAQKPPGRLRAILSREEMARLIAAR